MRFQNSAIGPDLGFYAARAYSLMRPPSTGRRWIRFRERSADSVLVEQVSIPMRDGITLAGTLFRPREESEPVPVIATATPYGKDRYDLRDYFRDAPAGNVPGGGFYMGTVRVSDHTAFEAPDPGYWIPNGYAVLLIDLPGLGASGSNPAAGIGHQQR